MRACASCCFGRSSTGDSTHLIYNGPDFFPTVCDYAGIEIEGNPQRLSLKPLVEEKSKSRRNTIGVESEAGIEGQN